MPNENIGKIKKERVKNTKGLVIPILFLCVFLCNFSGADNPILNIDTVE